MIEISKLLIDSSITVKYVNALPDIFYHWFLYYEKSVK